ncbi:uncharacterized protein G2W53_028101 [Senna tora]|uniref:Uncharacterized protein n=1 Tax=Senna tora TaxID=362788 RepID=A0A834W9G7_9FABA|nr:uncharacterized protein G2W53_028101 [Senna tora]
MGWAKLCPHLKRVDLKCRLSLALKGPRADP